jgi:hypothetical protein
MHRLTWIVLSSAVALCLSGCAEKENWQTLNPPDGRYSVELPGQPKATSQEVPTDVGSVTAYVQSCELQRGHVAYGVMFADYPADIIRAADPEELLRGVQEGSIQGAMDTSQIESELAEPFQGYPSRRFKVSGTKDGVKAQMECRIVLVDNRLYQQILAESAGHEVPDASQARFFDSLKIDAPQGGAGKTDAAKVETPKAETPAP